MNEAIQRLTQGLRLRVAAAFLVLGLSLSTVLVWVLDYAFDVIEKTYVETTLNENLEMLLSQRRENPEMRLPFSAAVRAYVVGVGDGMVLPEALRGLGPGIHELDDVAKELHVVVRDAGDERYVLTFDVSSLDDASDTLDLALLGGVLLFSAVSMGLGYWGAGRVIAPVRSLAAEVRTLSTRSLSDSPSLRGRFGDDEVGELAGTFEDYAHRLRAFVEREKAFTSDVSHELRNPIMVATSCLDILMRAPDPDAACERRMQRLRRAVSRMAELVEVFLSLAREQPAQPVPSHALHARDIEDMCREVVLRYEEGLRRKGLRVEFVVGGRPEAHGQASSARVVIDNLLSNAIRHTDQGTIQVRLLDEGIDIVDSGPGIRDEESERLYERAFRGSDARGAGFGLGLNIVQRLCEYNRWAVRLRNADDGGAVAELRFARSAS